MNSRYLRQGICALCGAFFVILALSALASCATAKSTETPEATISTQEIPKADKNTAAPSDSEALAALVVPGAVEATDAAADTVKTDTATALDQALKSGDAKKASQLYLASGGQDSLVLARLELAQGKIEEAKSLFSSIAGSDNRASEAHAALAYIALLQGNKEVMQKELDKALTMNPGQPDALSLRAEQELQAENYDQAEASFRAALKGDPKQIDALRGLGETLMILDRPVEAYEVLTRALDVDASLASVWNMRGRVAMQLENNDGAEHDLAQAISLEPRSAWNYIDRGRLRARVGNIQGALSDFDNAKRLDASVFLIHIYRGQLLESLDRHAESAEAYGDGLKLRPDYYPAYQFFAAELYQTKDYVGASQWFEKAWDSKKAGEDILLLSLTAAMMTDDKKLVARLVTKTQLQFGRDGLLYQASRYVGDANNESSVLDMLAKAPPSQEKSEAEFTVAVQLLKNGRKNTALTLLYDVEASLGTQAIQSKLAKSIIDAWNK